MFEVVAPTSLGVFVEFRRLVPGADFGRREVRMHE